MLRNHLKIALRNLRKYPIYAFTNMGGLSLGLAAFILILLYVQYEKSYDQFFLKKDQIYRIAAKRYSKGELIDHTAGAVPPLARTVKAGVPEIQEICRLYHDGPFVLTNLEDAQGQKVFEERKAYYADATFFRVFSFELIAGNKEAVLSNPRAIVLSESTAQKYFGEEDPIGKSLQANGQTEVNYQVTGIFRDPPSNTHFKPDILFSFRTYTEVVHPDWPVEQNWVWNNFWTYFVAQPGANREEMEVKINDLVETATGDYFRSRDMGYDFHLQALNSIHLHSNLKNELEQNGNAQTIQWLQIIAFLILLIAWMNYINLTTARSVERAKEVGVRKVVGANRGQLTLQFLSEAFILNGLALVFAIGIILLFLPFFNQFIETQLNLDATFNWPILLLLVAIGSLLSGIYPAMVLSSFQPLQVLKGHFKNTSSGILLRKSLVVFQYLASLILIGGTIIIYQQVQHLRTIDFGVDLEQVMVLKGPRVTDASIERKFDAFKQEAERLPNIQTASNFYMLPGDDFQWYSYFNLIGDSLDRSQIMNVNLVEYDFTDILDLSYLAGRPFDGAYNDSLSLVINEATAALWGYTPEEAIGKRFRWRYSPTIPYLEKTVVGVISNYSQKAYSLEEPPVIYALRRFTPAPFAEEFYTLKLSLREGEDNYQNLQTTLADVEQLWQNIFPADPFNYSFLDDDFDQFFNNDRRFGKVFGLFAFLAILIANLGLFALSSYTTLQKAKEIGIRKVLGASLQSILHLLTKDFAKLILFSNVFAIPIIYLLMSKWLENFEIRITIAWWVLIIPALITLLLAIFTIAHQTLKTALSNPVDVLRNE